jgi:hypothetical protein
MFDATQYATLRAVVDCMIPADESPGGLQAGVDRYIMHLLQHDGAGWYPQYVAALNALQLEAQLRYQCGFAELSLAQATALLQVIAAGDTQAPWHTAAPSWLAMAAEHCAEGFYADPRQGPHRDAVAWQMLGYEERR